MVQQVNDKSLSVLTGLAPASAHAQRAVVTSSGTSPAVRLDLSQATQAVKAADLGKTQDTTSTELVKEIRDRIQSGRFVVDYEQIGQALLRDVVAQVIARRD